MPTTIIRAGARPARAALFAAVCASGCAGATRHESPPPTPACEDVEPAPTDPRVLTHEEILALKDRITLPVKVAGPDPHYPLKAVLERVQGTIVAECRVMTNGCAEGCRIVQSLPYMDAMVLDVLRRRRFKPATLDGKPINVPYKLVLTMRLPPW